MRAGGDATKPGQVFDLLQSSKGLDDVHHAMLQEFDVPTAKLETDLLKLSREMLAKGLLVKRAA